LDDRPGRVERVPEDEAQAEYEHTDVVLEVPDESIDADVVRPIANVIAAEAVVGLVEDHDPEDDDRHRMNAQRKTLIEIRGHPHFVQPPSSCDSAITRPAAAITPLAAQ